MHGHALPLKRAFVGQQMLEHEEESQIWIKGGDTDGWYTIRDGQTEIHSEVFGTFYACLFISLNLNKFRRCRLARPWYLHWKRPAAPPVTYPTCHLMSHYVRFINSSLPVCFTTCQHLRVIILIPEANGFLFAGFH